MIKLKTREETAWHWALYFCAEVVLVRKESGEAMEDPIWPYGRTPPKTKTGFTLAVHGRRWTHPATLFLCLLLQEKWMCWSRSEEKRREGGQRLFGRYDERVKTMIVACFFLPWYQHRPCFCQVSASTSPCQLYVTHVIYHTIPYVTTYLQPTVTLLP